jgi:hypothetical protein
LLSFRLLAWNYKYDTRGMKLLTTSQVSFHFFLDQECAMN